MLVKDNLQKILSSIPQNTKLLVVSKTRTNEELLEAYDVGQRAFGENKVQELLRKQKDLPQDIEWHLIGHLQTNKVKSVIPFVTMIHSVDSLKILQAINKEASLMDRVIPCLLQIHIALEETKFGFSYGELKSVINSHEFTELKNVIICGVMGMATFTENIEQIRVEFRLLHKLFNDLKQKFFKEDANFKELSMGMSDDYKIAIEEGSTIVRIGSKIFGPREYAVN